MPDFLAGRAVNKTTIVFTLPNTPGALFKALSVFALRDIDLTKLESRPIPAAPGNTCSTSTSPSGARPPCGRALSHLAEFAPSLQSLGSYPSASRAGGSSSTAATAGGAA